jgi:hypothetical protein
MPCNYNDQFYFIFDNLILKPLTITQTGRSSKNKNLNLDTQETPYLKTKH